VSEPEVVVSGPTTRPGLVADVAADLRWSFTPPFDWLAGVVANLLLAVAYLGVVPLTDNRRHWVVLLGTYFGTFILADVTTTNLLGPDAARVRSRLAGGDSISRVLVVKNISLMIIVVVPTLLFTTVLGLTSERSIQLLTVLPLVAYPMLVWVAIGNVVSVLIPVEVVRIRLRWRDRGNVPRTARWLFHLAVPYLLLYPVTPLTRTPGFIVRRLPKPDRTPFVHATALWVASPVVWVLGLVIAAWIVGRRGLHIR
jgi:hypothetical protein